MNVLMTTLRRLPTFSRIAAFFCLLQATAFAQSHPHLFRQPPGQTRPGANATIAHVGDVDDNFLSSNPERMTIMLPGKPDLLVDRTHHVQRGRGNMVWRGHAQNDRSTKVTLTVHDGILLGHVQRGNEIFALRPSADGRTIIEKLDSNSFPPEWGHDHPTHGHERVPPMSAPSHDQSGASSAAPATAADGAITEIVLMSVYTPQARSAAGGVAQIQAQIQAAVDQANSAFINSNMTARYFLAHMAEVAHNDAGNISNDLDWVTGDPGVAALRNTYAADMVSLIVENGGAYCGIGWVQRNPGAGFAGYAFQVTARGCLTNSTLAHEHGHNMGMEHDPANAGISPAGASYDWSFGHNVPGAFRTIMSYACPSPCPRILHYSNPDILYGGLPTGIVGQRDNALTGDLIAPTVAGFRAGGGSGTNNPPAFTSDPISKPDASQGQGYSGSLSGNASDPDADPLTFAKTAGPAWLSVAGNGSLSGTPSTSNLGSNAFTVSVADGRGGSDTATLVINVTAPLNAPSNLVATAVGSKRIDLSWGDNSSSELGFKIERSANGKSYSQIATVGAGVTSFSNTGLRSGRKYYYRVRAYNTSTNSSYSNIANATAN